MAGMVLAVSAAVLILAASTSIFLVAVDEVTGGEFGKALAERLKGRAGGGR